MPELSTCFWVMAALTVIFFCLFMVEVFQGELTSRITYDFIMCCVFLGCVYLIETQPMTIGMAICIVIVIIFDTAFTGVRIYQWWKKRKEGRA